MITRSAYAEHDRDVLGADATSPAGRWPRRAPSVEPPLSAPNRMLATERPMARAISRVRNVPEAPTSVPATSSSDVGQHVAAGGDGQAGERVEQRDHDRYVGAADRQHQQHADQQAEQRRARCRPTSRGSSTSMHRRARRAPSSAAPKTIGSPGKTTGREVIRSCSLAKVTIEPAKETAPTTIVNAVAARLNQRRRGRRRRRPACSSSSATSAAAPPPTPLNSATICGIWVICTVRAPYTPPTVPIAIATEDQRDVLEVEVGRRTASRRRRPRRRRRCRLPLRAVFGPERPLSARMKQTPQARKTSWTQVGIRRPASVVLGRLGRLLAREHLQHPVGDHEAADHVHRREHDRDQPDDERDGVVGRAGDDDRAEQDDPVDRVGAGHQRGVQRRGDLGDHLDADEDAEDEDRQPDDAVSVHWSASWS